MMKDRYVGVTLTSDQIETLAHDLIAAVDDVGTAYEKPNRIVDVTNAILTYDDVKALNLADFDEVIAKAFNIVHSLSCVKMVLVRKKGAGTRFGDDGGDFGDADNLLPRTAT
jgi:hypothetical protein